jgi:hypothetical protein
MMTNDVFAKLAHDIEAAIPQRQVLDDLKRILFVGDFDQLRNHARVEIENGFVEIPIDVNLGVMFIRRGFWKKTPISE